ncbi:hypothetical protein HMSSN139_28500 [Paenibacillus sp. HMSSN-139]|nr:hypothetical protein HMSSN139_28500 [Paenibacillus sp. HMSSN-139]
MAGTSEWSEWLSRWQARLDGQTESQEAVRERMRRSNPAVIPRNHRVEEVLEAAVERDDYGVMQRLLEALTQPFAHTPEQAEYAELPAACDRPYRTFCGT